MVARSSIQFRSMPRLTNQWSLALLAVAFVVGCGPTMPPSMLSSAPPTEFSEKDVVWVRVEDGPSDSDNQRIGTFFKKHPSLLGSPDWTGQPEKYQCQKTNSLVRFYWFNGPQQAPTWTALEFNGKGVRHFDGVGLPGSLPPNN